MAALSDALRYLPEAERQIPLAVKYADLWILDAIRAEYGVDPTGAAIILAAVEAYPMAVSYPRRKDSYTYAHYRHRLISSYTAVVRSVDHVADLGLIHHFRQAPGGLGWQSYFAATDHLVAGVLRLLRGGPRLRIVAPCALTILRDADGMEVPYPETREIKRQERKTAEINECYTSADIQLAGEAPSPFSLASNVVRIFNGDFNHGGRRYTQGGRSWQHVPKPDKDCVPNRSHLLINGEPVVELDYSQSQPSLLYAKVGIAPPADCYDIGNWPRDLAKTAVLTAINAKSRADAIGAIGHNEDMGLVAEPGSKEAMATAAAMIAAIKRAHKPIADHFHTGAGLRLMRTESDLAEKILKGLILDKGIVTLTMHDGFIVPASKRADLEAAMDAAPSLLGLPRLGFKAA